MVVPEGGFDTHVDEMDGSVEGFREAVTVEHAARDDTGESIARSGIGSRDVVAQHAPRASV